VFYFYAFLIGDFDEQFKKTYQKRKSGQ